MHDHTVLDLILSEPDEEDRFEFEILRSTFSDEFAHLFPCVLFVVCSKDEPATDFRGDTELSVG